MTSFTTEDRVNAYANLKKDFYDGIQEEYIPFMGVVNLKESNTMDISELVLAAQSTLKNMKADTANMSVSNETILKNAKLLNMISKSMIEWAEKK